MKIAFVFDAIYPFVEGGVQKYNYEISRRLSQRGYEVHIFGFRWWGNEETIKQNGVLLHGVAKPRKLYSTGRRSIRTHLLFSYKLFLCLLKWKVDIIICDGTSCISSLVCKIISLINRATFIIIWYEVWRKYWVEYLGIKGYLAMILERIVAYSTKNVLTLSNRTKKELGLLRIDVSNICVIPGGIDYKSIQSIPQFEKKRDVIFVGRLIKDKHVDILIKALKLVSERMPKVNCLIIGDGPEKVKLEKMILELGLTQNVEFVGFIEDGDVISYMKSSKIFVFPSTREGFGIVVIEANACGLPVITIDAERNASSDLIQNGENGYKVRLSAESITEKIIFILQNEIIRKEMAYKSILYAKRYDWDHSVDELEIYLTQKAVPQPSSTKRQTTKHIKANR